MLRLEDFAYVSKHCWCYSFSCVNIFSVLCVVLKASMKCSRWMWKTGDKGRKKNQAHGKSPRNLLCAFYALSLLSLSLSMCRCVSMWNMLRLHGLRAALFSPTGRRKCLTRFGMTFWNPSTCKANSKEENIEQRRSGYSVQTPEQKWFCANMNNYGSHGRDTRRCHDP